MPQNELSQACAIFHIYFYRLSPHRITYCFLSRIMRAAIALHSASSTVSVLAPGCTYDHMQSNSILEYLEETLTAESGSHILVDGTPAQKSSHTQHCSSCLSLRCGKTVHGDPTTNLVGMSKEERAAPRKKPR